MEQKPLRIVYVDDDADDRFFFESAVQLINGGLQCTSINNGATAVQELHQPDVSCDLLFLDLNMPVKSGIDVLGEIQEVIHKQHLKIIIFTTAGTPTSVEETFKLNATLYVQKPGSFDELVKTIRSITSMHGQLKHPSSIEEFKFISRYE